MLEALFPIFLSVAFFLSTALVSGVLAGPTARLRLQDDQVVVIPLGIWKFWALRRKIRVPVDAFSMVEVRTDAYELPRGIRAPGTRLPRYMIAGSFRSGGLTTLFLTSRPNRKVLVAEFDTDRHQRFVIQVTDTEAKAAWLVENTAAVAGEIDPEPALAKEGSLRSRRGRTTPSKTDGDKRPKPSPQRVRKHGANNPGLPSSKKRRRG